MEKKNNIRSFRYSDRVAQILEAAEGDTLNAKFENLVYQCYLRLPEIEAACERQEKLLASLRNQYKRDYQKLDVLRRVKYKLETMEQKLDDIDRAFEELKDL